GPGSGCNPGWSSTGLSSATRRQNVLVGLIKETCICYRRHFSGAWPKEAFLNDASYVTLLNADGSKRQRKEARYDINLRKTFEGNGFALLCLGHPRSGKEK